MEKKLIRIDNKIKRYKVPSNSFVGDRIKKYRLEKGWSAYDLAKAAKLEERMIINIESGDKKNRATLIDLHHISCALGILIDTLIEGY